MARGDWRRLERIGGVVSGALPERVRRGLAGWRAVEVWPQVAGTDAARRSAAVSFRDGRLTVEVVNSVWMHQLTASTRRYVREINETLGAAVVEEIIYRVNPRLGGGADPTEERDAPR